MGYSVYKHTSPSGKVYIGITCNKPEYRWNHGKGYCHGDQPLFERAIIKYGWDNIKHEILHTNLSPDAAKQIEIALIKHYKELGISYNITDGGDGYLGNKIHLGRKASAETRAKMSASHKGKLTGKNNPMYGRHETNATYGKFSDSHPASKIVYQYTKEGDFVKKWVCISDVQRELGIIVTNITSVCRGKNFTIGGFRWSYSYPYIFTEDEKRRREEKRRKLSERAKNRRREIRQFDLELRQKDDELKQKKEIEMAKITAQKSRTTK